MKLHLLFTSILASTFISVPSFSSPLEGEMNPAYDVPYLWNSYAGYSNPDWMAGINGDKRLGEISIPGTHNSLSTAGNLYSITQTLDAADQLDMGVRYFDVRFKYQDGVLQAYHGNFQQPTTFDEFMGKVSDFLYAYPSETVLIRIQNEAGAETNQHQFFSRFASVAAKYRNQQSIPSTMSPRLDEVRGKFIFIRDFNIFSGRIGLDRRELFIQDNYTVRTNWELHRKWQDVKTHFNQIESKHGHMISLNYLSGSNIAFPYFVASGKTSNGTHASQLRASTFNRGAYPDFKADSCWGAWCSIYFSGTNQLTNAWIEDKKLPDNLGVVVMDFPGGALVDNIIQTNESHTSDEATTPKFTIFDGSNQQGDALAITSDMPTLGNWSNRMSSWQLPSGWEVRFYQGEYFQGGFYTRSESGNATGFDNMVRSIQILKRP